MKFCALILLMTDLLAKPPLLPLVYYWLFLIFFFSFLTVVANVACAFLYCSIIGLYVSMVFVIGRFARLFVSEVSYRIMFMELPYIDKILKLCLDIYLVRECCDFRLEEDLFAKLLFLYRSPETMIRWTKMKRE